VSLEQEKKLLAPLLAKLFISPASTPSLLRELYAEISEAAEDKKLTLDATGRNSLYKIHVSLGKIVNALDKEAENTPPPAKAGRKSSASPSLADEEESVIEADEDDKTIVERTVKKGKGDDQEDAEDEDTILALQMQVKREVQSQERDELVEELLSDVEMSGM